MKKLFYYLGKGAQCAGLALILNALIISAWQNKDMGFLFNATFAGMAMFMVGWVVQKYLP